MNWEKSSSRLMLTEPAWLTHLSWNKFCCSDQRMWAAKRFMTSSSRWTITKMAKLITLNSSQPPLTSTMSWLISVWVLSSTSLILTLQEWSRRRIFSTLCRNLDAKFRWRRSRKSSKTVIRMATEALTWKSSRKYSSMGRVLRSDTQNVSPWATEK